MTWGTSGLGGVHHDDTTSNGHAVCLLPSSLETVLQDEWLHGTICMLCEVLLSFE